MIDYQQYSLIVDAYDYERISLHNLFLVRCSTRSTEISSFIPLLSMNEEENNDVGNRLIFLYEHIPKRVVSL